MFFSSTSTKLPLSGPSVDKETVTKKLKLSMPMVSKATHTTHSSPLIIKVFLRAAAMKITILVVVITYSLNQNLYIYIAYTKMAGFNFAPHFLYFAFSILYLTLFQTTLFLVSDPSYVYLDPACYHDWSKPLNINPRLNRHGYYKTRIRLYSNKSLSMFLLGENSPGRYPSKSRTLLERWKESLNIMSVPQRQKFNRQDQGIPNASY